MLVISAFIKEVIGELIYIRAKETARCPICNSELRVIGSRHRNVIMPEDGKQTFVIRRLRCRQCSRIHHELPDFMIPFKRHSANAVDKIISYDASTPTDVRRSTAWRIRIWWAWLMEYFACACLSVKYKFGVDVSSARKLPQIVRAFVNACVWPHTRSATLSTNSS